MFGQHFENVKIKHPVIHNITNYVTVNDVANIILAAGGSPIMSDEVEEVADITSKSSGLYINIGTVNHFSEQAMYLASETAWEMHHKILLDPVGVGVSSYRSKVVTNLIDSINFNVIKGNISEILFLARENSFCKSVDANKKDEVTSQNLKEMLVILNRLAIKYRCVIVATGKIDIVCDGNKSCVIYNGVPQMSQITGTGCMLGGLMTTIISANDNVFNSCVSAVCAMGIAGEIVQSQLSKTDGNATFRTKLIDAIYNMNEDLLNKGAKYELY